MELVKTLLHPEEACALVIIKLQQKAITYSKANEENHRSHELRKCYYYMDLMSGSFSASIRSLDGELRDAVCILYLVLRALDAIEDDLSISKEEKFRLLPDFHRFLEDPSWTYKKSKDKCRILLEDFTVISSQFRQLKPLFQTIISDVCARMGAGMVIYLKKTLDSTEDWDEYCHYVSGMVFVGLSRMFSGLGMDHTNMTDDENLSNSIGVFLQKLDIIRDYQEDMLEERHFWPRQIYKKYCEDLTELSHPKNINKALCCLNEMTVHTLMHIPDVLQYLDRIQHLPIFTSFAIFQVLAVAILERCYNNQQVFRAPIKIRKGEAAYLMMRATNMDNVKEIFSRYLKKIQRRIPDNDPSAEMTRSAVDLALKQCSVTKLRLTSNVQLKLVLLFTLIVAVILSLF